MLADKVPFAIKSNFAAVRPPVLNLPISVAELFVPSAENVTIATFDHAVGYVPVKITALFVGVVPVVKETCRALSVP